MSLWWHQEGHLAKIAIVCQ